MGIEPEETPDSEDLKPFSAKLKDQTSSIHSALGVRMEPTPSAEPETSEVKPIVSKSELEESQHLPSLSQNDQAAKNAAVQKTLNMMRTMSGLAPKEEPEAQPEPVQAPTPAPVSTFFSTPAPAT